jgi:hypothetical protein
MAPRQQPPLAWRTHRKNTWRLRLEPGQSIPEQQQQSQTAVAAAAVAAAAVDAPGAEAAAAAAAAAAVWIAPSAYGDGVAGGDQAPFIKTTLPYAERRCEQDALAEAIRPP